MAVLLNNMVFDASQVKPSSGYEALPAGWYGVIIVGSEFKNTKDNTGTMMVLERRVMANDAGDASLNGRTFVQRLNLVNQSQAAATIAAAELSSICHVTGVIRLTDTTQLHNIPHRVRLDMTEETGNNGNMLRNNNVKEYQDMQGNAPGKLGQAPPPATSGFGAPTPSPAQQPPAAAAPAWQPPAQPQTAPPPPAAAPVAAWGAPAGAAPAQAAPPPAWGAPAA